MFTILKKPSISMKNNEIFEQEQNKMEENAQFE